MATDFQFDVAQLYDVTIKVIGVGGGGGNALDCMINSGVDGVEYIAMNTDAKALNRSQAPVRIQLGAKLTRGRGAGNRPEIGAQAAEDSKDEIVDALKGADMVFITAGMGGGTGTGAAPVVARMAQELDILVVGVVTKPFKFEREQKMHQAELGIAELRKHVDSLVVIPNERLLELEKNDKALTMRESFTKADDILKTGVQSISDLITKDGYINLDFADVKTIMTNAGVAHLAIGYGSGKEKATMAVDAVVSSPLLETSISGAKRLLLNIAMSEDTLSTDVDEISSRITEAASDGVELVFGAMFDEDMSDEIKITVIAAGYDDPEQIIKIDNPQLNNNFNSFPPPISNNIAPPPPVPGTNPAFQRTPAPGANNQNATNTANKELAKIFDDIFNND